MCLEWRWGEVCKRRESGRSYHWLCHLRQPHSFTISHGVFQKHPWLATDHPALNSFLLQFLSSFCSADFKGSSTMLNRPVAAHLAFILAGGCQQRAKIAKHFETNQTSKLLLVVTAQRENLLLPQDHKLWKRSGSLNSSSSAGARNLPLAFFHSHSPSLSFFPLAYSNL